ncbi:MAG TPA: hypothetical protein PLG90_00365 [Ignavibacteria bacterium]|nr:hypothetical protein [Ignavibacteria bacterium]
MTPSKDLFDLIKSLSKSEKRYFKIYASMQKGDKNYMKLFNEIEGQPVYDEVLIKEKFKNEKFIKQLTFTKNYLYKLINRSLISFHGSNSIDFRLNEIINKCKILFKKALYKQFFQNIKLGKKTALEYERFHQYLQFLELEKVLIIKKITPDSSDSKIFVTETNILKKIENINAYQKLISEIETYYRSKGRFRDKSLLFLKDELMTNPLVQDENKALSIRAKEHFFMVQQLIADLLGDPSKMYYYAYKRFNLLRTNPKPFEDQLYNYWIDTLTYLTFFTMGTNQMGEFQKYVKMLQTLRNKSIVNEIDIYVIISLLEVMKLRKNNKKEEFLSLTKEIEKNLKNLEEKIDYNMEILLNYTILRVSLNFFEYEKALLYANKLLNSPFISIRADVEWYVKLINLFIHAEIKNFKYLKYLTSSVQRYFQKRNRIFKLESLIINYIKKIEKDQSDENIEFEKRSLLKKMKELKKDPFERNAFSTFDFEFWIEETLKN